MTSTVSPTETLIARHVIGAESSDTGGGGSWAIVAPATGAPLGTMARGDAADVDRAVAVAEDAFRSTWRDLPSVERRAAMLAWAAGIEAQVEELARLDTLDTGKPLGAARASVLRAAELLRFYAGMVDKIRGSQLPVAPAALVTTRREPYGVVGAIIPWNYPASNFMTKVAPILACGNTVVVKPSEQASLVPGRLVEIGLESGFPAGVVNVVNGLGAEAGAALVRHPVVKKIAFTGSTRTGLAIMQGAGDRVKSFTMELGGKCANIVFPDADLDAAVPAAAFTAFMNAGQTCTAGSRLLLHDDIAEEFLTRLIAYTERLVVGDPFDPAVHIGSVVSRQQLDTVMGYLEAARSGGAVLRTGGHRVYPTGSEEGFFVAPTVYDRVTPESPLFQEEIFGPVLAVTRFADLDEAVALANGTDYGLAAAVWSRSLDTVRAVSERVDVGLVWVNTVHAAHPDMPYAGHRQSGVGSEMGAEAVDEYTQLKSVWLNTGTWASPWGPEA
ncbi:MAG: Aldehyde Dehydrogenase [Blastococcus sp.]|jgi:acyl-CoA reductase-like NAD-dependent aldehyde dehydrogenase|nr:Aldehyde Dehydrogenase [Blastococcus sp.]